MDDQEIQQLRHELETMRAERNSLHAQLTDSRLASLEKSRDTHETRIRIVEDVATKFNFLMSLSIGGGALSAIVLLKSIIGF